MNLKQLAILIVLLALIGGAGLYLYKRDAASWQAADRATGQKLLGDFPINEVAHIRIQQNKSEVNLVKQEELWKVKERYNYPANFQEISEFVRKVAELKGVQKQPIGPSQLGRLDLLPPGPSTNSGTLVEFKDKSDKSIRSLLLGKKHMRQSESGSPFGDSGGWPDGRFILVGAEKPTTTSVDAWVVSEPFTSIEPKPESWLNKDFFKVEKLRSISVTSTNATNNWKLVREVEGGVMNLADKKTGEELDSSKISSVSSALSYPSFNDVLSPELKPETLGLDKPITAVLDTFDNFVYTVHVGKGTNDENYPLRFTVTADLAKERTPGKDEKPDDKAKLDKEFKEKIDKLKEKLNQEKSLEKWTYVVSKWTIDPLLKTRADLLAPPKKEEASTNAPSASVIHGATTTNKVASANPSTNQVTTQAVTTPAPSMEEKSTTPPPPAPVVPVVTKSTNTNVSAKGTNSPVGTNSTANTSSLTNTNSAEK